MRRASLPGEHNEYVLKEILGMSDDEIARKDFLPTRFVSR